MTKIALVACSARKLGYEAAACDLYTSDLFRYSRRFAKQTTAFWFILSAKYGLVYPERVIAPYNETLKAKTADARRMWAIHVYSDIDPLISWLNPDEIVFLAGKAYRENLARWFAKDGMSVSVPLAGLGIGQQLKWLKEHTQ